MARKPKLDPKAFVKDFVDERMQALKEGAAFTLDSGFGQVMFELFARRDAVSRADVIAHLEPVAADDSNVFLQSQAKLIITKLREMSETA